MSEIDALRELNELKASLSYEFWDNAAFASLVAVFIGVVGEFVVSFTPWLKGAVWPARVAKASTLILIAGLGGDMITYAKNSAINGTIIGFLNKEAGSAYQKAEEAKERGDHLEALTDFQTLQIIDLQSQLGFRVPKVEQTVSSIQKQLQAAEQPREFDHDDLQRATRDLPRGFRTVTLMRLADPVNGRSADNLATALRALKPQFTVKVLDLPYSRFDGLIVCENGTGDVKVGKALKRADIGAKTKPMSADECKQTAAVPDPNPALRTFGPPPSRVAGTLIFVGHRPPPSP